MASILAGFSIGIACILFLTAPNPIIGAVLFGIGLLNIRLMKYKLFTGTIQKIVINDCNILTLLSIFILNAIGITWASFCGLAIDGLFDKAKLIAQAKISMPYIELLIRALVCGYLMTIATRPSTPLWMTLLCVFAFVYTGMCHCIADIFYYSMLNSPSACLLPLGITVAGNTVGGILAAVWEQ